MFGLTLSQATRPPRLLLVMAVALCLLLAGLIGLSLLRARDAHRAQAADQLADMAHNIAVAVDARLGAHVAGLAALARSELLQGGRDPDAFLEQARAVGAILGGVVLLYGPPPEGRLLATTSDQPALLRERIAAGWIAEATAPLVARLRDTGQPGLSDLFLAPVRDRPLFSIGVPVPGEAPAGRRLHLTLEPGGLAALLSEIELPPGLGVTIRDGRFRLVAASDPGREVGEAVDRAGLGAALADRRRTVVAGPNHAGQPAIVAAERLATDPRWTVTVSTPREALDAAAFEALRGPLLAALLLGLGIAALAWAARRERLATALREAATLREVQAQVDRLLSGMPAVLKVRELTAAGEPGRVLYLAGDVARVTGWPADTPFDIFRGTLAEYPEEVRAFRLRLLRDGEATLDWRLRQPEGGWRWLRWTSRLLEELPDGNRVMAGYVLDISAERLAQAQAQAAGRLASMAEMAHGLAHELKQPLQAIALQAATAEACLDRITGAVPLPAAADATAATLRQALGSIVQQVLRTGALVEHLRRFARGAGEEAVPEPVALADALDGALMLVGHRLRAAGIALEVALGDPSPVVLGQAIAIEQILINLLGNAHDAFAGRPATAPRRITVSATQADDGGRVVLTVADTAGGIPAAIIDRAFEPFVTTKPVEEGTGLGLAICHGLARGMGASIAVRNGAEGAVFTVVFQAAAPGDHARSSTT